jgi:hypothetical protein
MDLLSSCTNNSMICVTDVTTRVQPDLCQEAWWRWRLALEGRNYEMFLLQCNHFFQCVALRTFHRCSLNLVLVTSCSILWRSLLTCCRLQFSERFSRSPLLLCLFWDEPSFSCSVQASYLIMLTEPSEVTNISCPMHVVLSIYSGWHPHEF